MRSVLALIVAATALVAGLSAHAAPAGKPPVTRSEVNRFIGDVKRAIASERAAVQAMLERTKDGYRSAESHLITGRQDVYQPETFLEKDVSFSGPSPVPLLKQIDDLDNEAYHDLYDPTSGPQNFGKLPTKKQVDDAVAKVTLALAKKKKVLTMLDEIYVRAEPGTGPLANRCTATKEFDVYAIPAGFAGSYSDVYPHGIPKNAQNIEFGFIDTATGKPPAAELFPGQTWKATNKGFLADGRLDIHVDVAGTGFGAQDANKRHWKVVVTYDC